MDLLIQMKACGGLFGGYRPEAWPLLEAPGRKGFLWDPCGEALSLPS